MAKKLHSMQFLVKFYNFTGTTCPFGDSSLKTTPLNFIIFVWLFFQISFGSWAFSHVWRRNSSEFHPYSTGTCGNKSPEFKPNFTINPSWPTLILEGKSFGSSTLISSGEEGFEHENERVSGGSVGSIGSVGGA